MKKITVNLYNFKELDKTAKAKALTTYRYLNVDFNWWDNEYEDFIQLCACLGITVAKDSIRFSGFYSQGDGSAFSAKADLPKLAAAIRLEQWRAYAPLKDFRFPALNIDRRVMALVEKGILFNEPQIIGRHRHLGITTDLGIYLLGENGREHPQIFEELDELEAWLRAVADTLNRYLYRSLEKQYEFLTSDNTVEESILTNEYLFSAEGRSANHLVENASYPSNK